MTIADTHQRSQRACEQLLQSLGDALHRLFFIGADIDAELRRCQHYLETSTSATQLAVRQQKVVLMVQALQKTEKPPARSISVIALDGTAHPISLPLTFASALCWNVTVSLVPDSGLDTLSTTTVKDLKAKVEEVTGVKAVCQQLYLHGTEDALESDQTIDQLRLIDGDSLFMVVNEDCVYWEELAQLRRRHMQALMKVSQLCVVAMDATKKRHQGVPAQRSLGRQRVLRCFRRCRGLLRLLQEQPATHKPRSTKVLKQAEEMVIRAILPIFKASVEREAAGWTCRLSG